MVAISTAERSAQRCSAATCVAVADELAARGFCLVENLVDPAAFDRLASRLDADAAVMLSNHLGEGSHATDAGGHLALGLPRVQQWMPAALVANALVEQLASTILPDPFLAWVGGNTNLPGSGQQGLHSDATFCFETEDDAIAAGVSGWPQQSSQIIFQFSPREITTNNGATEIWPGSHADSRWAKLPVMQFSEQNAAAADPEFDAQALVAERRQMVIPSHMIIPRGAAVVRDLRCWHRGVPNKNVRPRHMLGVIYSAGYLHPTEGSHPQRLHTRLVNFNSAGCVFAEDLRPALSPEVHGVGPRRFLQFWNGAVDFFGNAKGDLLRFSDHDGVADHKGTWANASPRARYWQPSQEEYDAAASVVAQWQHATMAASL